MRGARNNAAAVRKPEGTGVEFASPSTSVCSAPSRPSSRCPSTSPARAWQRMRRIEEDAGLVLYLEIPYDHADHHRALPAAGKHARRRRHRRSGVVYGEEESQLGAHVGGKRATVPAWTDAQGEDPAARRGIDEIPAVRVLALKSETIMERKP